MYAVITPTQSLWPQHYLSLARSVAASNTKCIRLSLGTLYRDLLDDVVELRSSGEHLPSLFAGQLGADASLHLDVEPSWWFKLIWWMLCCNLRSGSVELRPNSKHKHANTPATDNSQLVLTPPPPYPRLLDDPPDVASAPPSTLFYSVLYENAPSISLDCVPYHALESAIRRLQGSLTTGSHLTIGFTTRAGPHAHSLRHPDAVISALPFFPRAYMKRRKWSFGGEADGARTTTPLFLTLPHALALFTSGPTPLTVELVRNVSQEYAMFLRRSVHDLEDDREIRDAFVREWGVAGWREERVCTAWEAALINAGLLAGWAIVVRK
ncbi:hypothetical protein BN946_scf185014.g99 [Trametes cinnabarina]|uniref:Uncharacterized protein n=1 Tax=Pycnoporus cinnabarinus TaxID=5643 RepID=A0A060SN12_PYCCI|nr:hypothetical protein BN946_scf185014.g99 [Trametes cinnabarina]